MLVSAITYRIDNKDNNFSKKIINLTDKYQMAHL